MSFQTSISAAVLAAAIPAIAQMPVLQTAEQAVYLSGDVKLEGGSLPEDPVRVQRVCKGSVEAETWTDTKGSFTFKVQAGGSNSTTDAAQPPARDPDLSRPIGNSTYYQNPVTSALRDCVIQAILPGFWSDHVTIALKNTLDDTRLGTIILHPAVHGDALTVSATTLQAPPKARKAYDKGAAAMREQKWETAATELSKAVEMYPKFAAAWFDLGIVREQQKDYGKTVLAWKEAINCDSKYVKPYEALVGISERQQNWAEVEKYSKAWISLAPEDFPIAYLYNALANARLNKSLEAETSARKGISLDKDHKIPRLSYVLGLLLMQKRDFPGAAQSLKKYLELSPNAKDAPLVRQELTRIEQTASAPPR